MKYLEQRQVFYYYFLNFLHVGNECKFKWQDFTDYQIPTQRGYLAISYLESSFLTAQA